MLVVTLLWSTAGIVSRQLEQARSFEVTFWRSFFTALVLGIYFVGSQGRAAPGLFRRGGWPLLISGLMWAVMFTCFMLALTLTSVANVLITMSLAPLFTALLARFILGAPVARRTWAAITLAGIGIAWMYGNKISAELEAALGTLVALAVPLAAAINWITLHRNGGSGGNGGRQVDLTPALLIGALLSCAVSLPFAWPLQGSLHDIGWLAGLGVFQLALPCMLAVRVARGLSAPELALLSLLEVVFGIAWAWLGAGERPLPQVLVGGSLVIGALAVNEMVGMVARRDAAGFTVRPGNTSGRSRG
ncbi:MAG: DMT family transporter [Ideonella sp.]